MTRKSCAVIVGLLVALCAACDEGGVTAPTGNNIVIYQHSNFGGDDQALIASQSDLDNLPGCGGAGADWNDCISSIRIPNGWEITVWEQDNFVGPSMTFTADVSDLNRQTGPCGGNWDDCISSLQIRQR
jgi:peptidase inhibitor family I36